jgi:hypothetical protein
MYRVLYCMGHINTSERLIENAGKMFKIITCYGLAYKLD